MKKWKEQWKELLPYEKIFEMSSWICLCAVIITCILDILHLCGFFSVPIDLYIVSKGFLAATFACRAMVCWRKNRATAVVTIVGVVLLGLSVVFNIIV